MSGDNGLLSQEEVDALFKQATGKTVARETVNEDNAAPPSVTPPPAPPPSPSKPAEAPTPAVPPETAKPQIKTPLPPRPDAINTHPTAPSPPIAPAATDAGSARATSREIKEIKGMLVGITQRIGALESRMNKLERKTSNGNDTRIKKLAADVKTLAGHLAGITQGLNNTPDYNLREEFQCDHCGSKGTVATKHRCTNCEKEGWWGWWPKKKR